MKCELCGRQYVALGVHLRHGHQVDPDDYREEYGLLKSEPLVDSDLSEHLSRTAKERLESDPEYAVELKERCRALSATGVATKAVLSTEGRRRLGERNKSRNDAYLRSKGPAVAAALNQEKTLRGVCDSLKMSSATVQKIVASGQATYNLEDALQVGKDRAAIASAAAKRAYMLERVAAVLPLLETTKTATEMCRLAHITFRTYRNWVRAGAMPAHPNGLGAGRSG